MNIEQRITKLEETVGIKKVTESSLTKSISFPGGSLKLNSSRNWFSTPDFPEGNGVGYVGWITPTRKLEQEVENSFGKELSQIMVKFYYDPDTFESTPYVVDIDLFAGEDIWVTNQNTFVDFDSAFFFIRKNIKSPFNGIGKVSDKRTWEFLYQ